MPPPPSPPGGCGRLWAWVLLPSCFPPAGAARLTLCGEARRAGCLLARGWASSHIMWLLLMLLPLLGMLGGPAVCSAEILPPVVRGLAAGGNDTDPGPASTPLLTADVGCSAK